MSRDDPYDSDFGDRPRRRSNNPDSSNKTLWIVLGVLGGGFVLTLLVCGGIVLYGFMQVKKGVENFANVIGPTIAAEAFLAQVKVNPGVAYTSTSSGFQSRQSKMDFEQYVRMNAILQQFTWNEQTSAPNLEAESDKPVDLTYILHTTEPPEEFMEDDVMDDDEEPKTTKAVSKPTRKTPASKPKLNEATLTLTLIQENGQWKVDAMKLQ